VTLPASFFSHVIYRIFLLLSSNKKNKTRAHIFSFCLVDSILSLSLSLGCRQRWLSILFLFIYNGWRFVWHSFHLCYERSPVYVKYKNKKRCHRFLIFSSSSSSVKRYRRNVHHGNRSNKNKTITITTYLIDWKRMKECFLVTQNYMEKCWLIEKFNGLNFSLTAKVKGFSFGPIDVNFTLKFQFKIHFSSRDINYLCLKCLCKKKEENVYSLNSYSIVILQDRELFSNI
jgi:hypothetical protein